MVLECNCYFNILYKPEICQQVLLGIYAVEDPLTGTDKPMEDRQKTFDKNARTKTCFLLVKSDKLIHFTLNNLAICECLFYNNNTFSVKAYLYVSFA